MFSDPTYSFSVCQKKKFVLQSKINIFHQIQPNYDLPNRPKLMTDLEGSGIQETPFTYIIST